MMNLFVCLLATYTCLFSAVAVGGGLAGTQAPTVIEPASMILADDAEETSWTFQVTTLQNTYAAAYPERDAFLGTVSIPDIGFTLDLYWSTSQSIVDRADAGAMCCFTCLPGDLHGSAMIMEHNYQQGKKLGRIEPGMRVYLDLTYGQYIFEAADVKAVKKNGVETVRMPQSFRERRGHKDEYGECCEDIVLSDGSSICDALVDNSRGDLYFMTCYPLDAVTSTNELFFVRCELVEGTQLVESQNTYS